MQYLTELTPQVAAPIRPPGAAMPRASIVITNYNYGRYLAACVASALAQDLPDFEVIVVDDGSTDQSLEILRELEGMNAELCVIRQPNGGQAAAMNAGWRQARGEWLLFLDADDLLEPDALGAAIAAADGDDAIVEFYLRTIDEDGLVLGLHPFCHVLERGDVFPQICVSGHFRFMPTSGNLLRRAALDAVMPIPEREWRICADTYVVMAATARGPVRLLPEILGSYRVHGANAWYEETQSADRPRQIVRNHLIFWRQLLDLRRSWPANCDDYTLLSLIRRILVSLRLYRDIGPLDGRELAGLRAGLLRHILRARITAGEKLLHLSLLAAQAWQLSIFDGLVGGGTRNAALARALGFKDRDAWLSRTARPAEIAELHPGKPVDFGRGGAGRHFAHYGFGEAENWTSWSSAERAALIFRVGEDADAADLAIELMPYLCAPAVSSQRVGIFANGKEVHSSTVTGTTTIAIPVAALGLGFDRIVALEFQAPDAVIPALIDGKNRATRLTGFALKSIALRVPTPKPAARRYPPLQLDSAIEAAALFAGAEGPGWHLSEYGLRLRHRSAVLRFSLPSPVMERFVICAAFERVSPSVMGDCRVDVELSDIARDSIDLRETGTALLVVPRGKSPASGEFELRFRAGDILPDPGAAGASGPCLSHLTLRRFAAGPGNLRLWRSHQIVEFSVQGQGRGYLGKTWHSPTASGVWSADIQASLDGLYFEAPGDYFLTMRLSSWADARLPRQHVRILANAKLLLDREIGVREDLLAIIPEASIGADRYLRLEIECRYIVTLPPRADDPGLGNVGICLERLLIEPLAGLVHRFQGSAGTNRKSRPNAAPVLEAGARLKPPT